MRGRIDLSCTLPVDRIMKNKRSMQKSSSNEVKKRKPTSLRDLGTDYRQAFVTFIDVLGFRRIVSDKKAEEINIILDKMGFFSMQPQLRHNPYSQTKHLPMVLQFSDSIIRIQPVAEDDDNISILDLYHGEITSLLLAQGNLVCNGVLVRGGFTYGKVCVHKDRIFGRAFNNAHHIESSLALYPRIVVDECLCTDFLIYITRFSAIRYGSQTLFKVTCKTELRFYYEHPRFVYKTPFLQQ